MRRDTGNTNNMNFDPNQITDGTPIFDKDGDKIGTVSQYDPQDDYLIMQKGWFFPHDVYVPLDAISRQDADGVYLRYQKGDLKDLNWDQPPRNIMSREEANDIQTARTGSISPEFGANDVVAGSETVIETDRMTNANTNSNTNLNTANTMNAQTNLRNDQTIDVPVREEQLVARKQQEQLGQVHVHKDVTQEQETLNVPVTHEEVRVERVAVQGTDADIGPDAFQERDIDVPVMGEEVVTSKEARVAEEIRLRKDQVTENQTVTDTVRKERVDVEGDPADIVQMDTDINNQPTR